MVRFIRAAWAACIHAVCITWHQYYPVQKRNLIKQSINEGTRQKIKGPEDLHSIDDEWEHENTERIEAEFINVVRERVRETPK